MNKFGNDVPVPFFNIFVQHRDNHLCNDNCLSARVLTLKLMSGKQEGISSMVSAVSIPFLVFENWIFIARSRWASTRSLVEISSLGHSSRQLCFRRTSFIVTIYQSKWNQYQQVLVWKLSVRKTKLLSTATKLLQILAKNIAGWIVRGKLFARWEQKPDSAKKVFEIFCQMDGETVCKRAVIETRFCTAVRKAWLARLFEPALLYYYSKSKAKRGAVLYILTMIVFPHKTTFHFPISQLNFCWTKQKKWNMHMYHSRMFLEFTYAIPMILWNFLLWLLKLVEMPLLLQMILKSLQFGS